MQWPQKRTGFAQQRTLFRRMLLSATLLIPAGSLIAEEPSKSAGDAKASSSQKQPAGLSLPTFPVASSNATVPSADNAMPSSTATSVKSTLPNLPPSIVPPASLPPTADSGTRSVTKSLGPAIKNLPEVGVKASAIKPPSLTVAETKSSAGKIPELSIVVDSGSKQGVASEKTLKVGQASTAATAAMEKRTDSPEKTVPSAAASNSSPSMSSEVKKDSKLVTTANDGGVKEEGSNDGVMIRFGVKPRTEATGAVRGIPGAKKEPIPTTSASPVSPNSSFRLSDKTNIAIAPKPEATPVLNVAPSQSSASARTPDTENIAKNAFPPVPVAAANQPRRDNTQGTTAVPSKYPEVVKPESLRLSDSSGKAPAVSKPTSVTGPAKALTASVPTAVKQQPDASQAPKSDTHEAVIFRPKAMIVETTPSRPSGEIAASAPPTLEKTQSILPQPSNSKQLAAPLLADSAKPKNSSEGSVKLAAEPNLELNLPNNAAELSTRTSTPLSALIDDKSTSGSTAATGKADLPVASTVVSAEPPKSAGKATSALAKVAGDKVVSGDDAMIALALPLNTDEPVAKSTKSLPLLVKSEPLPPADRTIKVGTAAFSTIRLGDQQVEKCEVVDPDICRAVVTTDGEVAILPGRVGVTRATLWLKQKTGESKVETAEITVGEALANGNAASGDIEKLNSTLKDLYPGCELSAVAGDRCIEIRGEVDSEQQAKAALQLVRKLCLVPVKDKVSVR